MSIFHLFSLCRYLLVHIFDFEIVVHILYMSYGLFVVKSMWRLANR